MKVNSVIWKLSFQTFGVFVCRTLSEKKNSPADFRTPDKEKLARSPSAGPSRADWSPFYLLHICNTAAGWGSAQTSGPSSCVQCDPVSTPPDRIKHETHSFIFQRLYLPPHIPHWPEWIWLTLFTRNPSLKTVFSLSASMLFGVISANELCVLLTAQVWITVKGSFCVIKCVRLLTPTQTHLAHQNRGLPCSS